MVEWWQALLIGLAPAVIGGVIGGGISLGTAYLVHRWTQQGAIGTEVRQARRDERRKAIAPVSLFLDSAAKVDAADMLKDCIRIGYERNVGDVQRLGTYERVEAGLLDGVEDPPNRFALARDLNLAFSAAPTTEWFMPLFTVVAWVGQTGEGSAERLRDAIQKVRKMVEDYVVEGNGNDVA